MLPAASNLLDIIAGAATFGLVFAAWIAVVIFWQMRRTKKEQHIRHRLGLSEPKSVQQHVLRLWHDGKEATTVISGPRKRRSPLAILDELRQQAGWDIPLPGLLLGLLGATLLAFVIVTVASGHMVAGAAAATGIALAFWAFLKRQVSRQTALFERQLVDALELAARSLRAGHPLIGAFRVIAEEIPRPTGTIFARICQQQQMGLGLDQAIQQVVDESPSADLKIFGTSVVVQLRSGGNLADMMERLAAVIRDRMRLAWRVRVLTAQTQFSKRVLMSLPFILFAMISVVNPKYTAILYDTPTGRMLLLIAAGMVTIGWYLMNKMAVVNP